MVPNPLDGSLRFEQPEYLVLLLLVPLAVLYSWRALATLGNARRTTAMLLRAGVITCLVLALAGAEQVRRNDNLSVLFVFDRSSSVPRAAQQAAFDFVDNATQELRLEKDRVGVLAVDGRAAVEQLLMNGLEIEEVSAAVDRDRTNLAAGLRMALALFTGDAARRVVVLSDGNENVGAALEEAEQYAAAGIPVDTVPLRYAYDDEIVFERLRAPPTAEMDETIELSMAIRSQRTVPGRVLVYHNERLLDLDPESDQAGYPVTLNPGANGLRIPLPLRSRDAHRFRAEFQPDNPAMDTVSSNNQGRAFTFVGGRSRVLLLCQGAGTDDEEGAEGGSADEIQAAQLLAQALRRERLEVDVQTAGERPISAESLAAYALVIVQNVPANMFTETERATLAIWVRDLGGGLMMIGGDEAFGAGGWMDTPVEDVMPVRFDVQNKKQIPKGALVMVMHGCEIPEGNYWAERVAVSAIKTLSSKDLVGMTSWDWKDTDNGYWDIPLQPVGNKTRVLAAVKNLAHGDTPDLDAIMRPGVEALAKRKDASVKHMIVISDFDPQPPRADLLATMKANNITCSTVAIGFGGHWIDQGKARNIASVTGGKYYSTKDYSKLPKIFMKEARIVRRSLIQNVEFTPILASLLPTTDGLRQGEIPVLDGYVLTTAKPTAQLLMIRNTEDGPDPILAQWQVGLGKSVAFTSGMWTRWGAEWTQWPQFSKLFAQLARWAARQNPAEGFDISTSVQGGVGKVRIEALDGEAAPVMLELTGRLVTPNSESKEVRLTTVGPGQYEAEFDARDPGSYIVHVGGVGGGFVQTGVSVAFSPEFRDLAANEALLSELAERTGGRTLDADSAANTFDLQGLPPAESRSSIWQELVRLMLILFLLDVAVRRIAIRPREAAQRMRRYIAEMGGQQPQEAEATLSSLRRTRAGMAGPASDDAGPSPDRNARYEAPVPDARVTEQLSDALQGASELDQPVVAKPPRKPQPQSEADFTSRLLAAKKKARDDMRDESKGE